MNTNRTRAKRRGVKLAGAVLAAAAVVGAGALTVVLDSGDSTTLAGSGNGSTSGVYTQPTVGAMNMGATASFTTPSSVAQVADAVPPVKAG